MTYQSLGAFRQALEQRLLTQSRETGTDLNRLRRRVVFERILVRLVTGQRGMWGCHRRGSAAYCTSMNHVLTGIIIID